MLLLLLACIPSPVACPHTTCQDEAIIRIIGREGPVVSNGTYAPEDGATVEYDCAQTSGSGWRCDADGTLHITTSASAIVLYAYGVDATYGGGPITLSWAAGGTAECPSGCEVANATVTLEPYDTACVVVGDTGGCG